MTKEEEFEVLEARIAGLDSVEDFKMQWASRSADFSCEQYPWWPQKKDETLLNVSYIMTSWPSTRSNMKRSTKPIF